MIQKNKKDWVEKDILRSDFWIDADFEHHAAAVVHLNFRSGSTFPVPVYTAPHRHCQQD